MSRLISVKLRGELRERFKKEERKKHDEETRSELIRDLLERGLDDRTIPLFARLDLPNRTKAQLENAREEGEPDEEIIRRFLKEAIEYREQDALDAIGAGGRLRSVVEQKQADGEELDETVKRQLRGTVPQREVILSRLAGKKFSQPPLFFCARSHPPGHYLDAQSNIFLGACRRLCVVRFFLSRSVCVGALVALVYRDR